MGSMLGRIFSGILDARIRSQVEQTIRHKGFMKIYGCKANVNLLEAALIRMKAVKGGGGGGNNNRGHSESV